MRTYPIADESGTVFAVEIENAYIGVASLARILEEVEGVGAVHRRPAFSASPDTHITFAYRGRTFIVWEPYGDSSRYWIGPEDQEPPAVDIGEIERALRVHEPSRLRKVIGGLLSLRFDGRSEAK